MKAVIHFSNKTKSAINSNKRQHDHRVFCGIAAMQCLNKLDRMLPRAISNHTPRRKEGADFVYKAGLSSVSD